MLDLIVEVVGEEIAKDLDCSDNVAVTKHVTFWTYILILICYNSVRDTVLSPSYIGLFYRM